MFPWNHVPDRANDPGAYKVKNDIKVLFKPVSGKGMGFLDRFQYRTVKELFCRSKVRYSEEDLLCVELANRLGIFRPYPDNLCTEDEEKVPNGWCCGGSGCQNTSEALYCDPAEGGCSVMSDPCP